MSEEPEVTEDVPDVAAAAGEGEGSSVDFLLAARDAAGFLSEAFGRRLSTASFRQLVIDREAPAPAETAGGTAKWSMTELRAWADAVLEAEAEPAAAVDLVEEAEKSRSAFVRWIQGRLSRLESVNEGDNSWCPVWWDHPEAVDRLHALWLAYIAAEAEGELSGWWVNHWDRHYAFLFGHEGVFKQCPGGRHIKAQERGWLAYEAVPDKWLPYPERVQQKEQEEA
ncbi:DUF4913 domain-containing protein [Sinomonas sp. ASV322]|uniref:DUF4913 domain-containing protein n=1 Tax=Sinomonas sp. ASV322 TaxID=3041920 RepID=UPI0027DE4646|nr:DUF4913 domain-containing protein [Sinomonas sp. ASV322]MDQ4504448.1 DUF4913 domain-containing protein [Sinomonas sp. ASV322]